MRSSYLYGAAVGARLLLEHVQLRQHGEALHVHGDGPADVGEGLVVEGAMANTTGSHSQRDSTHSRKQGIDLRVQQQGQQHGGAQHIQRPQLIRHMQIAELVVLVVVGGLERAVHPVYHPHDAAEAQDLHHVVEPVSGLVC